MAHQQIACQREMKMHIDHDSVLAYLEQNFGIDVSQVQNETPLFTSGLLDSFSVGDLLLFLEEQGKFAIEADEIVPENLDSVARIVAFTARKSSQQVETG